MSVESTNYWSEPMSLSSALLSFRGLSVFRKLIGLFCLMHFPLMHFLKEI